MPSKSIKSAQKGTDPNTSFPKGVSHLLWVWTSYFEVNQIFWVPRKPMFDDQIGEQISNMLISNSWILQTVLFSSLKIVFLYLYSLYSLCDSLKHYYIYNLRACIPVNLVNYLFIFLHTICTDKNTFYSLFPPHNPF